MVHAVSNAVASAVAKFGESDSLASKRSALEYDLLHALSDDDELGSTTFDPFWEKGNREPVLTDTSIPWPGGESDVEMEFDMELDMDDHPTALSPTMFMPHDIPAST